MLQRKKDRCNIRLSNRGAARRQRDDDYYGNCKLIYLFSRLLTADALFFYRTYSFAKQTAVIKKDTKLLQLSKRLFHLELRNAFCLQLDC